MTFTFFLFKPDNSKPFRIRVITISSNEKVSKYALKIFTYFSNVFLKCLNLDSFNLKFSSFITYVTSNIKSIFSAFLNRFSNFNFDINKIRLYKSNSVKKFCLPFFIFKIYILFFSFYFYTFTLFFFSNKWINQPLLEILEVWHKSIWHVIFLLDQFSFFLIKIALRI